MTTDCTSRQWEHEEGEITCSGAVIATVYQAEDFPCLDPEEHDIEAICKEIHAVGELIAAAPDLLAACEYVLDMLQQPVGDVCVADRIGAIGGWYADTLCRTAIAKAKGGAK